MKRYWLRGQEKFSALSLREKSIFLLGGIIIIITYFVLTYLEPVWNKISQQQIIIIKTDESLRSLQEQIVQFEIALTQDPDETIKLAITDIEKNIEDVDKQLNSLTVDFVPPYKMRELLLAVLNRATDVKVAALNSIPAQPIRLDGINNELTLTLYQHGVEVVVEGEYFAIINYLKRIETLPWKFFWSKFQYEVTQYPVALLHLQITTVSADEQFIAI